MLLSFRGNTFAILCCSFLQRVAKQIACVAALGLASWLASLRTHVWIASAGRHATWSHASWSHVLVVTSTLAAHSHVLVSALWTHALIGISALWAHVGIASWAHIWITLHAHVRVAALRSHSLVRVSTLRPHSLVWIASLGTHVRVLVRIAAHHLLIWILLPYVRVTLIARIPTRSSFLAQRICKLWIFVS